MRIVNHETHEIEAWDFVPVSHILSMLHVFHQNIHLLIVLMSGILTAIISIVKQSTSHTDGHHL